MFIFRKKAKGIMLNERDYMLLKRYSKARVIPKEERDGVRRLVNMNLLACGMMTIPSEHIIESTARLSEYGHRILRLEKEARGDLPWWLKPIAKLAIF